MVIVLNNKNQAEKEIVKDEKITSLIIGFLLFFISFLYFLFQYKIYHVSFIPLNNYLFISIVSLIASIITFTRFEYDFIEKKAKNFFSKIDIYFSIILMMQGLFLMTLYFLNDITKNIVVPKMLLFSIIGIAGLNLLLTDFFN